MKAAQKEKKIYNKKVSHKIKPELVFIIKKHFISIFLE